MALLLETTVGDIVIDLDVDGSPELSRNILKLAKARYYTSTLIYNVIFNRYCQLGDPRGDGTGGGCIYALLNDEEDITKSTARFLKSSQGRVLTEDECRQRGIVVATEMNGIRDTIGSQFLITLEGGDDRGLDGYIPSHFNSNNKPTYLSLGRVTEDDDGVLDKINNCYCDAQGRPYADIRIERALVIHDPFEDPPGFQELLQKRGISIHEDHNVTDSPSYERPPEEVVEVRISAKQVDEMEDEDEELNAQRQEQIAQKEDKSRAVVLEMLGDLPSADIKAPENVLFVCKLNSITQDEDLELIFSRFDPNVKVEIIRDHETGASLQYAFCEFSTKKQCVEAYFKMNGALIDDRRIKVDFSQSVAKIWDRYNQKLKPQRLDAAAADAAADATVPSHNSHRGRGRGGGRERGVFRPNGERGGRGSAAGGPSRDYPGHDKSPPPPPPRERHERHYHDDDHRGRYRDDYREDRRHHHGDYSPDDSRRHERSRSPSPDEERSRDYKRRRRHHSKKRDRRDHSRSRDGDERRRRDRSVSRSPARHRHDHKDDGHKGNEGEDGGESQSRQREDHDNERHHRNRKRHDEERRHRKKHHRRDKDDRHKKRRRRHSRSKSRS